FERLRVALQPLVAGRPAPLPAAADIRPHDIAVRTARGRDLVPPATGFHIIDPDIPAFEQFKWLFDTLSVIELRAAFLSERLEPGWIDKVRDEGPVDPVPKLVRLAGIADFIRIQNAGLVAQFNKGRQVNVGIGEHLQQFVAGRHRPLIAEVDIATGEYFCQWKASV